MNHICPNMLHAYMIVNGLICTSMSSRKHRMLRNDTHLPYTQYLKTKIVFLNHDFTVLTFNWNAVYIEYVIRIFIFCKILSRGKKKNQSLVFCFLTNILLYNKSIGTQFLKWLFTHSIFSRIDFVNLKERENLMSRFFSLHNSKRGQL